MSTITRLKQLRDGEDVIIIIIIKIIMQKKVKMNYNVNPVKRINTGIYTIYAIIRKKFMRLGVG